MTILATAKGALYSCRNERVAVCGLIAAKRRNEYQKILPGAVGGITRGGRTIDYSGSHSFAVCIHAFIGHD